MLSTSTRPRVAATLVVVAACLSAPALQADTIDALDRGWYDVFGQSTALNQPVGNTVTGQSARELRSFFVFDLASVSGIVSGATLRLELEAYFGTDPTQTFTVHDVLSDVADVRMVHIPGSLEGQDIFADLGMGAIYGSTTVEPGDVGSIVELTLSAAALSDLTSAAGGLFALGVKLDTLNSGVFTDAVRFSQLNEPRTHQLVLDVAQASAPGTITLLIAALALLGAAGRRSRA